MLIRRLAVLGLATLAAGCSMLPAGLSSNTSPMPTTSPTQATPTMAPTTGPTSPPTTVPTDPATASPDSSALYVRTWYTQALPPKYTFDWLPPVTISNGTFIDGNVAVPAIYPGLLLVPPVARSISASGTEAIAAQAKRLGLLDGTTDFTGGADVPGAKLGQIQLVVDGQSYALTGDPNATIKCITTPCEAAPGSPAAFGAFWRDLSSINVWLADELGPSQSYQPERVAMALSEPAPIDGSSGITPTQIEWPLTVPLKLAGTPYGEAGTRCMTVAGSDLNAILPILEQGNQLTQFKDAQGTVRAIQAVVLVPGQPSPCGPEGTT